MLFLWLGPLVATLICIGTIRLLVGMGKVNRQVRGSLFALVLIAIFASVSVGFSREYPSEWVVMPVVKFIASLGVIAFDLVIFTLALLFEFPFAESLKALFRGIRREPKPLFTFQLILSSITLFGIWSAELSVASLDGAFVVSYPPFFEAVVLAFVFFSLIYVALLLGRCLETVEIRKLSSRTVEYVYLIMFSVFFCAFIVLIVNFLWAGTILSVDVELVALASALAIVTYSLREILKEMVGLQRSS